jgi:transcriptional regulator with XRE-family HTH domain
MENRIKMLRECLGLTQKSLSDLSGINIRQIQKYESGEYDISKIELKNALSLSRALNVKAEELI